MEKENKLGTMPISKLIINMSLPIIISMLVQALYNIVDSVFVSRVCEQALTAVSLAFPAQNLMIGLATGTAVGVNALMGRALGAKDQERANAVAINGVFLAVVGFAICAVLALLFAGPFFRSQTQIDYIVENGTDYLLVCCCGSLGLFCEIMFERLLQGTGRSILSMYTQGLGAIVNIVLDPIFIFVLDMGVTGADVRDNMTSYYKMVCYGKAPKVLIWSVDPWVLYGDEAAFDKRADVELYNEFLTKVLGVETDYEEEDRVALWKALVEPAYFQGNVDYYLKNRGQSVVTDDDGNPIDFNPVDGDPYEQPTTIKRSDGSVLYDPEFRDANTDQVRALAAEACPTFNSVHMEGFDSLSPKQEEAFDKFIQYARNQGTTVILALYDFLLTETDQHQGFFETENWIRQYAHDYNIPLYGSYDPTCIKGLDETDFFDGLHCKGCGIAKFFPGVPQVLQDVENNTLPDPLSVTPRTTLPVDGEENVENVG